MAVDGKNLYNLICPLLIVAGIVLPACSKNERALIITTRGITGITNASASSGGIIVHGANEEILEVGIVWNTSGDPTTGKNSGRATPESGNPDYRIKMEGLEPETVYYVRAYGINNSGTFYGEEQSFKTYFEKVEDIDGNTLYTLRIGTGEWTASNINTGRYRNGDVIPDADRTTYNLDEGLGEIYGSLYSWFAISDERGLCPAGWTVPEDRHWKELEAELGMSQRSVNRAGLRDRYAGGKLKETGTSHWNSPNVLATDIHGFTALPGGYRHITGSFAFLGESSNWWTSSGYSAIVAWYRNIYHENGGIYRGTINKSSSLSVRCVKINK
jgi:uncharacterized protein (TIGR02145 family)